jgi:hypothetical protein
MRMFPNAFSEARMKNARFAKSLSTSTQRSVIERLEGRHLLSAAPAPITSFLGEYIGSLQFTGGETQTVTLTVTSQKKRSFSGNFVEGDGTSATFKGTVAKRGTSRFTYHVTNVKPKTSGVANIGLDTTGEFLTGLFISGAGKHKTTGAFVGVKQTT